MSWGIYSSRPRPYQSVGSQQSIVMHTFWKYISKHNCIPVGFVPVAPLGGEICLSELHHSQGEISSQKMAHVYIHRGNQFVA